LAGYLGPRDVALDLGAHVGTRSIWLATDGGFKSVWAVECAIDSFNLLCKNITRNKLNITPLLAAVSVGEALAPICDGGTNKGQRSVCYRDGAGIKAYYVMTTALTKLITSIEPVNFIKMDIEGAEYEVIEDIITSPVPIVQVLIEFHHRFESIGVQKTRQTIARLNEAGYMIFNVSASGEEISFIKTDA
ncbi:MAG: FkbM family methyltransferase, partial [Bacteroidales bacterium]|nr:FkbM family methyltransferase [Bacteroidales bacterium]